MVWLRFGIIVLIMVILIGTVKYVLRKAFKIKKVRRKFFSYHHINELHRKVDWIVRIASAIVFFISFIYIMNTNPNPNPVYPMLIVIILIGILNAMIRGYFEWKHSEEPKQAILTIAEILLIVIAVGIIINYDLLGLL